MRHIYIHIEVILGIIIINCELLRLRKLFIGKSVVKFCIINCANFVFVSFIFLWIFLHCSISILQHLCLKKITSEIFSFFAKLWIVVIDDCREMMPRRQDISNISRRKMTTCIRA